MIVHGNSKSVANVDDSRSCCQIQRYPGEKQVFVLSKQGSCGPHSDTFLPFLPSEPGQTVEQRLHRPKLRGDIFTMFNTAGGRTRQQHSRLKLTNDTYNQTKTIITSFIPCDYVLLKNSLFTVCLI